MVEKTSNEKINKKRLETLVDGIFAIAMTLLVLSLDVPSFQNTISNAALNQALFTLFPKFFIYGLSFILLAVFWEVHHKQFSSLKRADMKLLWINVLWLMFVVLVPFSTSLVGEYGYLESANVFFDLNMFFIGFVSYLNWRHITYGGLIHEDKIEESRNARSISLMLPAISLVALGLALVIPTYSNFAYLLIPFIQHFIRKN